MEIKKKNTGLNVSKNETKKNTVVKKIEAPKIDELKKITSELEKLKKENELLKQKNVFDLEKAKEIFSRKSDVLKLLNIYDGKKDKISEGLEIIEREADEFSNNEISLTLAWGYNEKIKITGRTIILKLLQQVQIIIDEKKIELEQELLTI